MGHEPGGRHEVQLHARHVRRHDRRADPPEQVVLLRQLSGRTAGHAADAILRDGGARRLAAGRPEQPAGAEHHHPRSADRPGVSQQPDSGEPVQPVCAQPVRRRDAVPAGQRRAADERLPRELSRDHRVGAERRSVRREVRLERLGQRQAVRALLAADGRFRDVADASCRCRSRRRRTTRSGAWPPTGTASSATRSSTTCWSATATDRGSASRWIRSGSGSSITVSASPATRSCAV